MRLEHGRERSAQVAPGRTSRREPLESPSPMHRLNHPVYRNRMPAGRGRRAARRARLLPRLPAALPRRPTADPGSLPDAASSLDRLRRRRQGGRLRRLRPLQEVVAVLLRPRLPRRPARRRRSPAPCSSSLFTVAKPFDDNLPRSVAVIDLLLTLMLVAGARLAVRLIVERPAAAARVPKARGARRRRRLRRPDGGPRAAAQSQPRRDRDRLRRRRPPQARHAHARVKVLGSTEEIAAILDETEPDEVVIAIPSAPGDAARPRSSPPAASATSACAPCRRCSSSSAAASSSTASCARSRSRTSSAATPIVIELDRVGAYLQDRIVLVTGAGGSIGSELCRQIAQRRARACW